MIGFPLLPDPSHKDEIADLSRDFNTLVRNLNEANAKLFEVHQSQLEHADRLASTGEMAASIAHEIKNPLAGILGAVQVFDSEVTDDDPKKEILSEMKVQLERMNHAVNDLLSYARPAQPVFEPVRLHDLIKKIVTLLPHQFKEKNIVIKEELSPDTILIHADKKQFQQVMWNIVLNGMQAMDHGGVLTIRTGTADGKVTITIKDTGKGIPPDQVERVFKPFYTTKHKGTGLGMTISRRIIEQHNGSILVRSTVGTGTIVEILLPSASR
jgi:signal transduction histidine kinase